MKKLWIIIVKLLGWRLLLPEKGTRPEMERCVFVAAPHTSIFDFFVGAAYLWACCSNGKVLIKKEFFFWPLGPFLRKIGGMPVDRKNPKNGVVRTAIRGFANNEKFSLAITPEGTRGPVEMEDWRGGFWLIAKRAGVCIVPTYIDFKKKEIGAFDPIKPSDSYEADLQKICSLYHKEMAKHPENFVEARKVST